MMSLLWRRFHISKNDVSFTMALKAVPILYIDLVFDAES